MPRDPQKTREALLATASGHFQEAGFHGTDTNRIARDSGYAPQTFYRHFEDKRAVFLEVYRGWSGDLMQRLAGAETPAAMVRTLVDHHRAWGPFRASLVALSSTDPFVRDARLVERRRQIAALRRLTDVTDARLLYLMWACERVADGIALGEARAMRVSERSLLALLTEDIEAAVGTSA